MEEIQDYASLVELEYVETEEEFAESVKKFLRRYHTSAKKLQLRLPKEENLDEVMKLVDRYGVKLIRAAIIAHALVKAREEGGD
jgi:hypothetical protein